MPKMVFGLIGVIWGAVGLFMLVFPTLWRSSVPGRLRDPGYRFVVMQIIVLIGLVLVMGTPGFQGSWIWVSVGTLGIAIASFILGCSSNIRDNLVRSVERWPLWLYRLYGVMMMSLAFLFGADLILYGS